MFRSLTIAAVLAFLPGAPGDARAAEPPPFSRSREEVLNPESPFKAGPEVTIVQTWTRDGRHLVYKRYVGIEGNFVSDELFTAAISARDGVEARFDELRFFEWSKKHPKTEQYYAEPRSATGVAEAVVEGKGKWVTKEPPYWYIEGNAGSLIRSSIRRGGVVLDSHVFKIPPRSLFTKVELLWAPKDDRIAWLFSGVQAPPGVKPEQFEKLVGYAELVIDRAVGPRLRVARAKATPQQTVDAVYDLLEKAGYAPTYEKAEAKEPPRSIVYARPKWRKEAEAIAKSLPGGADVRPLASGGKYEVVVAVGRSAVLEKR